MNARTIYCLVMILCTTVLSSNAQTVIWSVKPMYETIKPYSESLYLCQLNGKWGVVDAGGKAVLPNQYDFITTPHEGNGLFGTLEGGKNRLNGLISPDGTCTPVNGTYYVIPHFPHFSEGKLCVSDPSGKQGFMDENGKIVVKCQFDVVRPFKEGLSSIRKGPWVYYIRENHDAAPDRNVVYAEWRNGQITEGSSFKNGEAVVGYGGKYKVIDLQGRELRNFSASKWKINPADYTIVSNEDKIQEEAAKATVPQSPVEIFSEDGKYGFRLNGKTILYPTLSSASPIDLNQVSIAAYHGKTGLLKVIDGVVQSALLSNGQAAERIHVDKKGKTDMLQYAIILPKQIIGHTKLLVDKGNSHFEDVSSAVVADGGNKLTYDFYPEIEDNEKDKSLKCKLLYEGMEILNETFTLSVERPVRLRLSEPFATTAQADIKTEIQEIASTIFNDSDRDVTVTATLSVNCRSNKAVSRSFNITIPGNSSRRISVPVTVKVDEHAAAVIRLNSGEQKKSTISLKIY